MEATRNLQSDIKSERAIFRKANELLQPGPFFRLITYLYAERRLYIFFFVHFMCTMVVWFHFALIKFNEQERKVPGGANRYWLKRIAPSLEFGSMHAILFQMALIPLTMCRFSIATLSESILNSFVPMNQSLRMHIHLGYTMVTIVFLATIFFFIFFGILCRDGEQTFCNKFTEEIMISGYLILVFLLIIGGTSYFRHNISYEVFYAIHHVAFVMYAVAVAHTFDAVQRNDQRNRSQNFRWFSTTLLYYLCDRAAMSLNHSYHTRLIASTTIEGSDGSKMMILKLRRPILFNFKPGQYAFLRLQDVDTHWHPFSIASGPSETELEFYIEVFGDDSWTGKVWSILKKDKTPMDSDLSNLIIDFEIMGPCGMSLGKTEGFSNVLAVGAGTGIVPIMSLFRRHVNSLMKLDPETHLKEMQDQNQLVRQIENAKQARKGSIIKKTLARCFVGENIHATSSRRDILRDNIRRSIAIQNEFHNKQIKSNTRVLRKAVARACRSIYGVVLLSTLPVFGVTIIALTISWNTVPIELFDGMTNILRMLTYIFHACFTLVAFFVWDANNFFAYTDVAACLLLIPLCNWYLHNKYENNGVLQPPDITLSCLLTAYLTARVWAMAVKPRYCSWRSSTRSCIGSNGNIISTLDRLEIVWITRSSNLVAEIVPELDKIYNRLIECWGYSYAREVCRISVYLTDKDRYQVSLLQQEVEGATLFQHGCIQMTGRRPKLQELIQDYTLELVCTRRNSYSLLAFCGSPELAVEMHRAKISNEMITSITGNRNHQMEFISESYGGSNNKKKKRKKATASTMDSLAADDKDAHSSLSFAETTMSQGEKESLFQSAPLTKSPLDDVDKKTMLSARVDTVYSGNRQQEYVCAVAGHYFL